MCSTMIDCNLLLNCLIEAHMSILSAGGHLHMWDSLILPCPVLLSYLDADMLQEPPGSKQAMVNSFLQHNEQVIRQTTSAVCQIRW